jgi:hypothetical protein
MKPLRHGNDWCYCFDQATGKYGEEMTEAPEDEPAPPSEPEKPTIHIARR